MIYDDTLADFRRAIRNWIIFAAGHDRVFYAMTNFTRPKTQYLTYRIENITPDEFASYNGFDDQGREIVDLNHHVAVSIRCYRDDLSGSVPLTPMSVLNQLVHSINKKEIYYNHFSRNCIGHLDSSTVSDRSIPLDSHEWEQRAMVLLNFHVIIRDVDEGTTLTSDVNQVIWEQTSDIESTGNTVVENGTVTGPTQP